MTMTTNFARALAEKSFGVGLKPEYAEAIFAAPQPIDFFEIHAENYMNRGGANRRFLARIRELYPISLHGVGLSLGSPAPLDQTRLERLVEVADFCAPALVSEHLAWCDVFDAVFPDLLPLPYDDATLNFTANKIDQVQEALGRQILIENPASYLRFLGDFHAESDFLATLAQKTGCGLLLDVNNIYVSATNHGFSAQAYLENFPHHAVGEIHLAGFSETADLSGKFLIDSHGAPVAPEVWRLYEQALRLGGPKPSLLERDNFLPDWPTLRDEILIARQIAETVAPHFAPHVAPARREIPAKKTSPAPREWPKKFAAALRDPSEKIPDFLIAGDPEKRFAVYRNNWAVAAREALRVNFPTLVKMLGDEAFDGVATLFARETPPKSPILGEYGEAFPKFLDHFLIAEQHKNLAYLPDLGRLDWAALRAARAAELAPADLDDLGRLDPAGLGALYAAPHPSATLLCSPFPLSALSAAEGPQKLDWRAENLLVLRPDDSVRLKSLTPGAAEFFAACAQGASLADAAEQALAADSRFDFGATLVDLTRAGAFLSFSG